MNDKSAGRDPAFVPPVMSDMSGPLFAYPIWYGFQGSHGADAPAALDWAPWPAPATSHTGSMPVLEVVLKSDFGSTPKLATFLVPLVCLRRD